MMQASIAGKSIKVLIDTSNSENFINRDLVKVLKLKILPKSGFVSMASWDFKTKVKGCCNVKLIINNREYDILLSILPDLCTNIILGLPFLKLHQEVRVKFYGDEPVFNVCGITKLNVPAPKLFTNLTPYCKPIITKSTRFSPEDRKFIESEVSKMLKEGIIEKSQSPWRAQVVVTTNSSGKKRLVVDFS